MQYQIKFILACVFYLQTISNRQNSELSNRDKWLKKNPRQRVKSIVKYQTIESTSEPIEEKEIWNKSSSKQVHNTVVCGSVHTGSLIAHRFVEPRKETYLYFIKYLLQSQHRLETMKMFINV